MPIYEYRCSSCGHQQEYLQKVSDAPRTLCPQCGKESLEKMVTAAGFQLKGSGWYATDFKASGSKPAAKPDSAANPDSAAKSESAAKPDGGSETKDGGKGPASACGTGACPACR